MQLKVNEERYSLKYALSYTFIISIILLLPFYIYVNHTLSLQEAKTEIELKKKAMQIILDMEKYDQKIDKYYTFPRYKLFQAGLYDTNYNPIFTLLQTKFTTITKGYHKSKDMRRYIIEFESDKYFGAKYLVVETKFDIFIVLQTTIYILLSIVLVIFVLSFLILKNFVKPLNEINIALDRFIKDSMHEINTPLSIININIDMYQSKYGTNKYFLRIKSAVKILSTIYNDMNYLIKSKSINEAIKTNINFSDKLKKSIDYFDDVAQLKGLHIVQEIQEDIYIDFVEEKLQKIIDNNISNAIKYGGEENKIIIKLYQDNTKISFIVQDFGIGIKDPEKIFDRFYREDSTKGGFGIGLNIVKKIVDEENIKTNVVSKIDEGTTFEYIFSKNQITII